METDVWVDPGMPFVQRVSLDNWVHDMSADSLRDIRFAGDTYRVPLEAARNHSGFDPDVAKKLTIHHKRDMGAIDNEREFESRAEAITQGEDGEGPSP